MPLGAYAKKLAAQERWQPEAQSIFIPAPIGGLNGRDGLAAMPATDAVILDNFNCMPGWIEERWGSAVLATFTGVCRTLAAYNGASQQLFGAVNNSGVLSIFRMDNAGGGSAGSAVVGGAGHTVQAITNEFYDACQFGTGAAQVLYLVNGGNAVGDNPLLYDGTTWRAITTTSTPYALTGGPTLSTLSQVVRYKSRLWFAQYGTFNVYYLPQNVFAGALTQLNLGPNFTLGGFIQTMVSVSIDNSADTNDYLAFVSNMGEVIVYQGYDPSSTSTWSEAAHFMMGRPLAQGRKAWVLIGSDALILSVDGIVPLSAALLTDRTQPGVARSDKIRKLLRNDIAVYAGQFGLSSTYGWQLIYYPAGTKLICNVAINNYSTAPPTKQYMQNTLHQDPSGGWSTYNYVNDTWAAQCFEIMGDRAFYGTNGSVCEFTDNASFTDGSGALDFSCTVQPAANDMGMPGRIKDFTGCVLAVASANQTISARINTDFQQTAPSNAIPIPTGGGTGIPIVTGFAPKQVSIDVNGSGYFAALQLVTPGNTTLDGLLCNQFQLYGIEYLFKPGTLLYG